MVTTTREILEKTPGVMTVRRLSDQEIADLLEPWLGEQYHRRPAGTGDDGCADRQPAGAEPEGAFQSSSPAVGQDSY
ncbi:hypothetical protein ACFQH4_00190 [Pseudidiomarina halophila]